MNRRDEATEVVGRFKVPSNAVSPALICRLRQIAPRFTDEFIRSVALPVIKGRPFSNRLIDWLCVNYSKVSSVRYGAKPGFFWPSSYLFHRSPPLLPLLAAQSGLRH